MSALDDIMSVPEVRYISVICSKMAERPLKADDVLDLVLIGLVMAAHHPKAAGVVLEGLSTLNPQRIKDIKGMLDDMQLHIQEFTVDYDQS